MEIQFEELRKKVHELERMSKPVQYTPSPSTAKVDIEIRLLSFDALSTELDKLYKVRAAKKYLKA